MSLQAKISGIKELSDSFGETALQVGLQKTFDQTILALHHEIRKGIKQFYAAPTDPASVAKVIYTQRGNKFTEASLTYRYVKIPLSRFPVQQVRLTTRMRRMKVTRVKGHARFERSILNRNANTYTKVLVLRAGGYKVVEGTARYGYQKGWLHTGKRGAFASQVFERNQRPTWSAGVRLPIHRLFGPSLSQMIASPRMQTFIVESQPWRNLTDLLMRNLNLSQN